jgi:hypothetical protein
MKMIKCIVIASLLLLVSPVMAQAGWLDWFFALFRAESRAVGSTVARSEGRALAAETAYVGTAAVSRGMLQKTFTAAATPARTTTRAGFLTGFRVETSTLSKSGLSIAGKGQPSKALLERSAKSVENYLGGRGKIIRNSAGDAVIMKGDKKIRFDINKSSGDLPHFHVEKQTLTGKWKDVGKRHRYYFRR